MKKSLFRLFALALCAALTASAPGAAALADAADGGVDLSGDASILRAVQSALSSEETAFSPEELIGIRSLTVNKARLRDLQLLSHLTGLESLDLSGSSGFTELSALSGLTNLKNLNLSRTRTVDISALSSLASLEEVNLAYTKVTDLSPLAGLSNLRSLDIGGGNASDLTPLSDMQKLEKLSIARPNYRHRDLSALSGLKSLVSLDLTNNIVTDISPLSGLSALETLTLTGNKKLADVEALSSCSKLTALTLNHTIVAREDREALVKELPKLTIYWAKGANAYPTRNPKGLLLLGTGKDGMGGVLESDTLTLDGAQNVELDPLVAAIKVCMPKLKHLTLKNCNIAIIKPLSDLTEIETLDLSGNQMTALKPLVHMAKLSKLTVAGCDDLTADDISWLTERLPDLVVER